MMVVPDLILSFYTNRLTLWSVLLGAEDGRFNEWTPVSLSRVPYG